MADFPTSAFSPRSLTNYPGRVFDAGETDTIFAEDLNNLGDEVVAIENFLLGMLSILQEVKVRKVYDLSSQIDGEVREFVLPETPVAGSSVLIYSSYPNVTTEGDFVLGDKLLTLSEQWPTPEVDQKLVLICDIIPQS